MDYAVRKNKALDARAARENAGKTSGSLHDDKTKIDRRPGQYGSFINAL